MALGWSGALVSEPGSRKPRPASDLVSGTIRNTLLNREKIELLQTAAERRHFMKIDLPKPSWSAV